MIQHRHEDLSKEEEERLSDLFNRLDVNKDGKIDMKDLTEAWYQLEVPTVPGQAQVGLHRIMCHLLFIAHLKVPSVFVRCNRNICP